MDIQNNKIVISDLVKMDFPQSVMEEVKHTLRLVDMEFDFTWFEQVFRDTVKLFNGAYPGYKQCNTRYHDLMHTTDVLLALTRLIHGAHVEGIRFKGEYVTLALISALFHDSGYIQESDDNNGTGAKYTLIHVERSIEFTRSYFIGHNYDQKFFAICQDLIRCTDPEENVRDMAFAVKGVEPLGRMLAAADILGPLANRLYLEKLLHLFREFNEVQMLGYRNELDLMKETLDYYRLAQVRLAGELGGVDGYMLYHFRERWKIDSDMYRDAIENNMNYLAYLIENHEHDYRTKLNRGGVVANLMREEGK